MSLPRETPEYICGANLITADEQVVDERLVHVLDRLLHDSCLGSQSLQLLQVEWLTSLMVNRQNRPLLLICRHALALLAHGCGADFRGNLLTQRTGQIGNQGDQT